MKVEFMSFEIIFVLLGLIGMLVALILDKMRPGIVLLSLVVLFMVAGIITPKQMVAGFSNRGMITVALLFLVSEGIRQSGALSAVVKRLLPERGTSVTKAQLRILPIVSAFSAFLNNTPVVVIFAPILKNWSKKVGLSCTKFLIPLSYATILGGLCTLIGTSTNLVVHGMMIDKGMEGLKMFDLAYIGIPITVVGLAFIILTSKKLLPAERPDNFEEEETDAAEDTGRHVVEVVLASRFPGLKRKLKTFDFKRRYGAEVKEIRQNGQVITDNLGEVRLQEGDTLVLLADDAFTKTWGDSSVFLMMTNGQEIPSNPVPAWKKWTAFALLIVMSVGCHHRRTTLFPGAIPQGEDGHVLLCLGDGRGDGLAEDVSAQEIYEVYQLGHPYHHCLCLCHQCGDGRVGFGGPDSGFYQECVRLVGCLGSFGVALYRDASHYRTDYEQCGGSLGLPLGAGDGGQVRGRSHAVLYSHLYCRFRGICHADRLPDESDCAGCGQL